MQFYDMKAIITSVLSLIILLFSCCTGHKYRVTEGRNHTHYRIKYLYDTSLDREINAVISQYYSALNPFDSTSTLYKINNNVDVEPDTLFVRAFKSAMEISHNTSGMVDITCAPLLNLWGFGFERMDSISPFKIDSLKQYVGYRKVRIENNKVIKDNPSIQLSFSSIGDGFCCDIIAEMLDGHGVENYMIDVGGEMLGKGINEKGEGWRLGIAKPVDDPLGLNKEVVQLMQYSDRLALATSGDYRNFYIKDGKKYAHTLNPVTGYPAAQNILSATVIAKNCIDADGYATAIMALGTRRLKELPLSELDFEYFIIYVDEEGINKTDYSEGMVKYMVNRKTTRFEK